MLVSAQNKLEILSENDYLPGEEIKFTMILYNEKNIQISGKIDYVIQNYYSEIVDSGVIESGEEKIHFGILNSSSDFLKSRM